MQIGDRFDKLTLIDDTKTGKHNRLMLFHCDCGNDKYIDYHTVLKGAVKSCGCLTHVARYNDLTGKRFGKLYVLNEDHSEYKTYPSRKYPNLLHYWKCRCDCGNITIVEQGRLISKHTQSCGCYQKMQTRKAKRIHGDTKSKLYRKWRAILSRCYNPKHTRYYRYGGRGIYVCDEWLGAEGYIRFKEWCYNNGYKEEFESYADMLTLDRKDNDGPYAPWNCRITDWKTQQNNRSDNKYIFDGEEQLTQNQCDVKYGYPDGFTSRKRKAHWPDNAIIYIMRKGYKNVYKVKNQMKFYTEDRFEILIPTQERLYQMIKDKKI